MPAAHPSPTPRDSRPNRRWFAPIVAVLTLAMLSTGSSAVHAGEAEIKDSDGMPCHVYTPDPIDPSRTYWLVVGVHGHRGNGKGAAGLASWAATRPDCIVIGPNFKDGYQGAPDHDRRKLKALIHDLGKQYRLHPRIFLYGFSGGAQFAHRFLFQEPNLVAGCSAHSGGTWETKVPATCRGIPCAFSCGELDTAKSFPEAPMTRIEWFRKFQKAVEDTRFTHAEMQIIPGTNHRKSPESDAMTLRCFEKAIQFRS